MACTVRGGHFLPIHTLHLTELCHNFDHLGPNYFTNNTYLSVPLTIAHMLVTLVYQPNKSFPVKAIKAMCQMILHPAHYIPQINENLAYIYALEDARVEGLKTTEKEFKNNRFLNAFKDEPSFSHPNERKRRPGPRHVIGYDEKLAIELAFWVIIQYKLEIKACIPFPLRFFDQQPDFFDMEVPGGRDYVFDGNWEHPGNDLDLEDMLKRYRHKV
jgi:hypothetical protein